jgi:Tol biopolymer transport system component
MRSVVVGAALLLSAASADAGDPYREFFTLESDHFVVHYYAPLEDVARRVAVVAEAAHRTLTPALDHTPDRKTIIVVVDDTDSANGFAMVLPRNQIQLYATGPGSFTELDDHDDWLYGLTAHEYTHVVHLDTMGPLPRIYNKIFGKTWSPNQVMPRWIIEGIATYEESKRSAGGRNRGSRFEQVIRIARHEGKQLRLDEVSGAPRQFPRGNSAYIYGSHFLRYVFDRYGDDTLREMSHTGGNWPIPFAVNRQIAKVVGKPFTELYDDWNDHLRDRYGMQEMAAERRGLAIGKRLTNTGELNFFAQYSADGKEIYWLQSDGKRRPHVRAMPVGGGEPRDVAQIEAMGPFQLLTDNSFIFEQGGRVYRRDYAYQDLFRWDARTKQESRITKGMRARDPAVSPDERRVAFSKNEHSESVLAIVDTAPGGTESVIWRGQRYDQAFQPAWSPDGTKIAFSAWRKGGFRDILVVEIASGAVEEITVDRAIDMNPAWSRDGRYLYFDSDRTGISNVFVWDTRERAMHQVTNVLGGAFRPHPHPDGTRLVFDAAVAKGGYDVYELPLDPTTWLPARNYVDDKPPPKMIGDDEAKVSESRPYRPIETLAPQSYTLSTTIGSGQKPEATLTTGGADAFNDHIWSLSLGLDFEDGDLNIAAFYGYGGWRQNLRFAASRTVGDRNGFRVDGVPKTYRQEDWSATISSSIPFEARPDSSWSMSFDYDFDYFRIVDEPAFILDPSERVPIVPLANYRQAGVGMRVSYSRIRAVTFGLGPASGFDLSASLRLDHPALGATYRNMTTSYATSGYLRLFGETPTLAARLAGSYRAGDLIRNGGFGLGGTPTQDIVKAIVESLRSGSTGFLRGYKTRELTGNQFHLLNVEYRQELLRIERGIATLPIYFRRLHLGVLSDTGTAFDGQFDAERHVRTSLGAALRLDAYFGYYVPGTFELGYSHGLMESGISEAWFLLTGSL